MIKQLVSFGCSWIYGDELLDPALEAQGISDVHCDANKVYKDSHTFPGLIAKKHGWKHICLGDPGTSLTSAKWNIIKWIENASKEELAETFIIVGLTGESRHSWYNPNNELHDHIMNSAVIESGTNVYGEPYMDEWREFDKLFMTLSECNETRQMNYTDAVRTIDGISVRFNIPIIQVNLIADRTTPKLPTLVNSICIMDMLLEEEKQTGIELHKPEHHPNEKGHTMIAAYISEYIKQALEVRND